MKICSWKRFLTFIAVVLFLVILVLSILIHKEPQVIDTKEYEIQSGETLWSIATQFKPHYMSIQEYIYNLREYNNIDCLIYPNEVIQILIYEEV